MNFGEALVHLKAGGRVMRPGWNSKNQYVYRVPPASYPAQTHSAKIEFPNGMVPYAAYLAIKLPNGIVATWAPSCSDALAEDWRTIPV